MDIGKKGLWSIIGGLCLCTTILLFMLLVQLFSDKGNLNAAGIGERTDSNKVIARIGDREITLNELYEDLARSYGTEVLNRMIDNHAVRLEAELLGISVTTAEIEGELRRMSVGYNDMNEYFQAMKEQLGLSKEDLYADAEYNLLLEKITTKDIEITDKQIDDYMRLHKDEFKARKEFHIQQIILATEDHANKALNELKKGIDFAVLVRDRSIDDASASSGGDLGWVEDNDPFVPSEILRAAALLQVGKISGVIELSNGNYAIIKLLDQKTEEQESEEVVRERVRKQLALQKALPVKEVVQQLRKKHGAIIIDNRFHV